MYKNSKTGGYNLDGTRQNDSTRIPPLWLIMPEDADEHYSMGWYFCDECEHLNGPFNTMEEAAEASKKYGNDFLFNPKEWFESKRDQLSEPIRANFNTWWCAVEKYGLQNEVYQFTKQFYDANVNQKDEEERFMAALNDAMTEWDM